MTLDNGLAIHNKQTNALLISIAIKINIQEFPVFTVKPTTHAAVERSVSHVQVCGSISPILHIATTRTSKLVQVSVCVRNMSSADSDSRDFATPVIAHNIKLRKK